MVSPTTLGPAEGGTKLLNVSLGPAEGGTKLLNSSLARIYFALFPVPKIDLNAVDEGSEVHPQPCASQGKKSCPAGDAGSEVHPQPLLFQH